MLINTHHKRTSRDTHLAALDLGSNTCRLLIARPYESSFKISDSFTRVTRLGEGIRTTGILSEEAQQRTIEALHECAKKLAKYPGIHGRAIATEACRQAKNGKTFIQRVASETGLHLDIISEFEEARLALKACSSLVNNAYDYVLAFDIGGCSTEVMWAKNDRILASNNVKDWISIPYGVVSLLDSSGGDPMEFFNDIRTHLVQEFSSFKATSEIVQALTENRVQVIGTSGTTTSTCALYLNLPSYDRSMVDGTLLPADSVHDIVRMIKDMPLRERTERFSALSSRSDLVICGLIILQALCQTWPIEQITVADRGVRDGILADLLVNY